MTPFFTDPTFAFEFMRILGESSYGGADVKECLAAASAIADGDIESWHLAWIALADRLHQDADACLARGHRVSARDAYLRASNYYRTAEFFLRIPIGQDDPRAMRTYEQSVTCFHQAMPLLPYPCETVEIPYENTTLPGYFYRVDGSARPRPTLLVHGGYDSTSEEQYFEVVLAALERGYNCLAFEGPGQGGVIRHQNLPFRPDWERVITPAVDYALSRPEVDPQQLALQGRSFGGYLAPRASAFERRLAACIAVDGMFEFAPEESKSPELAALSDEQINQGFEQMMAGNFRLRWAYSQGVFSMHACSPADFLRKMQLYTMEGIAAQVTCPTLVCDAEGDLDFGSQPRKLFDALTCPKTYLLFTAAEGAEEHCHEGAFRLANQRIFDWLDETLA